MDIDELKRRERWYELAASIAETDRPRSRLSFWLCIFQVADEPKPTVAVPTPGVNAPTASPGVGSGAADPQTRALPHTSATGFVGPAAPQPATFRPVGRGAATPHPS